MIDGLKLTLTGEELQRMLGERADEHREIATRWEVAARGDDEITEDAPRLPKHMCENEADRHAWRADVLEFLRDHLEPLEIYRLGESDLAFAELLPARPSWLEDEYEELTRVGFGLEQIARRVCVSPEIIQVTNPDTPPWRSGEDD